MQSVQKSEGKRNRRKRTDDDGRTFTCKCGKSYLSYPALYTHIKTKHSDQPLSRISRHHDRQQSSYQNDKPLQKGQQQKQKQQLKQRQRQKQPQDNYPLYGNSLPQVNNIQALRQFLFKYFPNIIINTSQSYKNEISTTEKKQLKQMKDYWISNGKKKQQDIVNQIMEVPIKYVLGKFIMELQIDVQNMSFKRFILMLVFSIKRAVEKIKGNEYFAQHNASQLPLHFDVILREHFLQDSNDYLSNPTIATKSLYYLGRWLYVNKFTNLSLKYNF